MYFSSPFLCSDAFNLTLDPNTANTQLILSDCKRKATFDKDHQPYPDHPERFENFKQVLCRESLAGRCYWEVEWSGLAYVAVTYKGIRRKGGSDCWFGYSDKSWSLFCTANEFTIWHNNVSNNLPVPPLPSNRVGVYLDWSAGILSFYSVSDTHTLTHLHTVKSTFTEPLYAGFGVYDSSLSLCQIAVGNN
ncbi:hypothetical protein M9458_051152 [Cirrhinus mrigala]|uniref:B30.2/SPRY domain-containing protein n=1 Tax=Cirrhinus mrigala TaxID=683832 RepID=A0ABD0MWB6_CIRMR